MYDDRFYATIREGCRTSARATVPRFAELYRPQTVVDVGCGEGWWGATFADYCTSDVLGIDGSRAPELALEHFVQIDLTAPNPLASFCRFDLAVCLEVAEHLPEQRAEPLVEELCALAPVVLFSAAQPGQGGTGHVNCQPAEYWAALFELQGYAIGAGFRDLIWDDERIEPWYRSNILVATAEGRLSTLTAVPVTTRATTDLWLNRRQTSPVSRRR